MLAHLIRSPGLTGAVAPSSPYLARALADAALGAAYLVELGAGTGAVTRVLARRFPQVPLSVVELQPELAAALRLNHPQAEVHARPAAEVLDQLCIDDGPVVLVSSLPFRSLPAQVHAQTRHAILRFLQRLPGSWLVQYTYQPRAPFDAPHGLAWQRRQTVMANLPPAGVWTLRPSLQTARGRAA